MSETTFFKIILQAADFPFDGRDEIEEPLDEASRRSDLGEVTGGGSGTGITNIDVEVTDPQLGISLIRGVLQELAVDPSTIIRQAGSSSIEHPVYEPNANHALPFRQAQGAAPVEGQQTGSACI